MDWGKALLIGVGVYAVYAVGFYRGAYAAEKHMEEELRRQGIRVNWH